MDKRSKHDLLSDLPLSIIHIILALVPIRDAVRTSILSKQWRYKWATLPHLVFDDEYSRGESLAHFITQALFHHQGPIRKFELLMKQGDFDTDQWLPFLPRNDIKMLTLITAHREIHIHSSIYSFQNLTHLDLRYCEIPPPPPTFNGFLSLRRLILVGDVLYPDTTERLIANCSLLEELELEHHHLYSKLEIHAPNLKIFDVHGCFTEICLYAPLLAKMTVLGIRDDEVVPLQEIISTSNYTKLLGGLTNLEELTGDSDFLEYLRIGGEPSHSALVFRHLRVIRLFSVRSDEKQLWAVVCLGVGAPNLHKLLISFGSDYEGASEVASIPFWDSELASNLSFAQLKLIEMTSSGKPNEMKFAKFLLASSPVLEKLKFDAYFKRYDDQGPENLATELCSYRRASANARIFYRNGGLDMSCAEY